MKGSVWLRHWCLTTTDSMGLVICSFLYCSGCPQLHIVPDALTSMHFATEIRIARIFNTYGPRMNIDDGRVVSNFIAQSLRWVLSRLPSLWIYKFSYLLNDMLTVISKVGHCFLVHLWFVNCNNWPVLLFYHLAYSITNFSLLINILPNYTKLFNLGLILIFLICFALKGWTINSSSSRDTDSQFLLCLWYGMAINYYHSHSCFMSLLLMLSSPSSAILWRLMDLSG